MTDISVALRALSSEQVVEAATTILVERFGVTSFEEAVALVANRSGGEPGDGADLAAWAQSAATQNAEQIVSLMAATVEALAEEADSDQTAMIEEAVQSAGEKQIVVDGGLIALGVLLLCGYATHKTGGVAKTNETMVYEDAADGRRLVTVSKTTEMINPFSPLGRLFDRIFGRAAPAEGGGGEAPDPQ